MPNKDIVWRPYQVEAVQAPISAYREGKRQTVIGLPTGAGKTLVSGGIIEEFLPRTSYALVVVPRLDLVDQTYKKYIDYFFEPRQVGVIQGNTNQLGRRITIASKDTLDSPDRLERYVESLGRQRKVDMLIYDEAHLSVTDQYRRIKQAVLSPWGMLVGPSATPYRADGQSLEQIYPDGLCYRKDIWELMRDKHLVDIESLDIEMGFEPDELMITGTGTKRNSKVLDQVKAQIRYAKAYDSWWHLARTKRTLIFAQNLEDAQGFYEHFSEKGVVCHVVTGKTKKEERDHLYADFVAGRVQILINFNVMTTGNDIAEIECIILGRATDNLGLATQMIGRGLRLAPHISKEKCLILNLTGKHHTLMMFKKLFGSLDAKIPSIRALIIEKEEKEKKQLAEREQERIRYDIAIHLGEVTARRYDMLIGDGWQEKPVIGDWLKKWTVRGKEHTLVAEKSFAGGYQPVHLDAKGRREVLSDELLTLPDAQRRCQQYITEQEHKESSRDVSQAEKMRTPITDPQFTYLRQRNVCIKNAAGKSISQMNEQEIEAIKAKMTLADYGQIAHHMKTYGSPFSKIGGNIGWFENRGTRTWVSKK